MKFFFFKFFIFTLIFINLLKVSYVIKLNNTDLSLNLQKFI